MSTTIKTKSDLRAFMEDAGSHFFDRQTMKFFNSKLENVYAVPDGALFITSERFGSSGAPRMFKVRHYVIGEVGATTVVDDIRTLDSARKWAKETVKEMREGGK